MYDSTGYAIVTGGGSGIGRAFCLAVARRGWRVAVVDLDCEQSTQTLSQVEAAGGKGEIHCFDVSDFEAWNTLHEKLRGDWPRLDLLVNNAGALVAGQLAAVSAEDQRRVLEVNLAGTLWGCRAMLPWMQSSDRSNCDSRVPPGIINVASIFASLSPPGFAAYNASKAGIVSLSETLRGELRPFGLRATVVLPGVVPTPFFSRAICADQRYASLMNRYATESKVTPNVVVDAAFAAHRRGRLYAIVGGRARVFWRCKQLFPSRLIDLIARRTARELEESSCST